jgi:hypothetical protein
MHKLNDNLIAIFDFFYTNIPPFSFIAWFLPLSFCFAFFALFIAGWLKKNNHWRTGYSRKLFHFIIFFSASAIQLKFKLWWIVRIWLGCFCGLDLCHIKR